MPKYQRTEMENPEKYDKKKLLTLKDHRTIIKHWEFMELRTYGGHKWNYYKLYIPRSQNIEDELSIYFTDYKKYKKLINTKWDEELSSSSWVDTENVYINGSHGTLGLIETDTNIKVLDFAEKESKDYFKKHNLLTKNTFFKWILLVATEESIETAKYISDNFFILAEKFKIFCKMDMTPAMVMEYFNKRVKEIPDHNIEPIQYVVIKDFYNFLMNPIVYSISIKAALDKLFYLIERSDFLKGLGSGVNWRPSFKNYTNKLDDIFNLKYHLKDYQKILNNCLNYKRLSSNELKLWDENGNSSIINDVKIPGNIMQLYSFNANSTMKVNKVTKSELDEYKNLFNKKHSKSLLDVQKKYNL